MRTPIRHGEVLLLPVDTAPAELCQANAFGIPLAEWLSVEQEG